MRRDHPTSPKESKALLFRYRMTPHHYFDTGEFAWFTAQIETLDGRVIAEINGISDYESACDALYDEANKVEPRND